MADQTIPTLENKPAASLDVNQVAPRLPAVGSLSPPPDEGAMIWIKWSDIFTETDNEEDTKRAWMVYLTYLREGINWTPADHVEMRKYLVVRRLYQLRNERLIMPNTHQLYRAANLRQEDLTLAVGHLLTTLYPYYHVHEFWELYRRVYPAVAEGVRRSRRPSEKNRTSGRGEITALNNDSLSALSQSIGVGSYLVEIPPHLQWNEEQLGNSGPSTNTTSSSILQLGSSALTHDAEMTNTIQSLGASYGDATPSAPDEDTEITNTTSSSILQLGSSALTHDAEMTNTIQSLGTSYGDATPSAPDEDTEIANTTLPQSPGHEDTAPPALSEDAEMTNMIPFLGASQENAALSENAEVANTVPSYNSGHENIAPQSPADQPFPNATFYSPGRVFNNAINQLRGEGVDVNYINRSLPMRTAEATREEGVNAPAILNSGTIKDEDLSHDDAELLSLHEGVLNSPFVISNLFRRLFILQRRITRLEEKGHNDQTNGDKERSAFFAELTANYNQLRTDLNQLVGRVAGGEFYRIKGWEHYDKMVTRLERQVNRFLNGQILTQQNAEAHSLQAPASQPPGVGPDLPTNLWLAYETQRNQQISQRLSKRVRKCEKDIAEEHNTAIDFRVDLTANDNMAKSQGEINSRVVKALISILERPRADAPSEAEMENLSALVDWHRRRDG
ncbi:unnamed protein product [Clonostachys solani]|uniref:Uncharacterized protein n=1 Tax=Clonostachys solani TaxID=160281 RepID=A0A9N9VWR3_9HYPO|nr:unnamed protein product [Clonostachys solani]